MNWQPYHTVWTVMVFGWISNFMVRTSIAPLLVPIMREFNLSYTQAGLIASAFFYAYTSMQLPAGHLGDRLGRKIVLVTGAAWWGLMSLLTGLATSFTSLFIFRFLTGLGQGTFFGNDRPVIAAYTPKDRMGFGQGASFIGLGIGTCLGLSLSGLMAERLGWRSVFVLFAIPSFVAALLIALLIREPPRVTPSGGSRHPYALAFSNGDLWRLNIGGIAIVYSLWVVATWTPAMFKEIGVETLGHAALSSSLLGLSAIPGLLVSGRLSDWLVARGKGRKGLIGVELLGLAISMGLIGYAVETKASALTLTAFVFLSGLFVWGIWAPIYALLPEMVPKEILGTTYGLGNTIMFLGSLIAPWLTGLIKDSTGSFSWGSYTAGILSVVGACLILGIRPAFRWKPEASASMIS